MIDSNKNGILFNNNNNNHDKKIKNILALVNDENKLKQFGKNGRKLIEKKYSWKIVVNKIVKVYKDTFNNCMI